MSPRIAIITTLAGPGPVAGGVWEVALMQARALAEQGNNVKLVAGWLGSDPPSHVRGFPVRLVPARICVPPLGIRSIYGRGWTTAIRELADDRDVAHVHLCRDFLSTQAIRILSRRGVLVAAQSHGMLTRPRALPHKLYDRAFLRNMLTAPKAYLTLTRSEDSELAALGVPPGRITPIHNAAQDPTATWSDTADVPQFLFASRLHERKQPDVFLSAAFRLLDEGYCARFIIAGPDQGELPKLRQMIAGSRHEAAIEIVGALEHAQLMNLLAASTAFVLPSKNEPYPMSAIESAAVGTPMILTREVGFADLLRERSAATLIEPSVGPVAEAMRHLIENPTARQKMSEAARNIYERYWRPESLAHELQGIYGRLHEPVSTDYYPPSKLNQDTGS